MFGQSDRRKGQSSKKSPRAYEEGPPGALGRLPFTQSKDPWTVEWGRRQQDVVEQYWRDKKKMQRKKRSAQRDLKESLRREKDEIHRYYRLHELDRNDPRRGRAEREARRRFRLTESKLERKHREGWQKQLRGLQLVRDKQKRKVTKQMKLESRKSRGLPGDSGLP